MTPSFPLKPNLDNFPLAGAVMTVSVAVIVLFGWAADITVLKSLLPSLPPMKPLTAIAFVFSGVALYLLARYERGKGQIYAAFCGTVVFLVGGLLVVEYIAGVDFHLNRFLVHAADEQSARMSLHSALNFTLLGLAIVLIAINRFGRATRVLLALVGVITLVAMLGLLYGAKTLLGMTQNSSMALHTALIFLTLTMGLGLRDERSGFARLLQSTGSGASMGRRIVPVVLIVPPIIGLILHAGFQAGLYDASFRLALTVAFSMAVMAVVLFHYSISIDKMDLHRRKIEADLAEKEARFREVFDYSQGMICIHDAEGVLSNVNPAVLAATGYSKDDLIGKNITEFLPEEHRIGIQAFLRQIEHEGLSNGLLPIVAKNGRQLMWRYHSILVTEDEKAPYVIGHALDVTELMAAQSELKNLSLTDELTGLLNRRGFLTHAEQQLRLERHSGTARGLALMFADMDGLKKINDTLGHEAGSDAIQTLASIVKSVVRSGDLVARWGGDEFVILTVGAVGENVHLMSERIEAYLEEYNSKSDKPYKIECSIGVTSVVLEGDRTFEDIIAEADEAMYEEKKKRKAGREIVAPAPSVTDKNQAQESLQWY